MALLNILRYPDERLRNVAKPVTVFDSALKTLAADMAETMYAAKGVGLAAIQVNVQQRIIVIDVSESRDDLIVLVNPEVLDAHAPEKAEEGCLSVPGIYAAVERPHVIRFRYQNLDGEWIEKNAEGLLAVCVQHEIDHLNGKVFVDYLSLLKQNRIKNKLLKELRDKKWKIFFLRERLILPQSL